MVYQLKTLQNPCFPVTESNKLLQHVGKFSLTVKIREWRGRATTMLKDMLGNGKDRLKTLLHILHFTSAF